MDWPLCTFHFTDSHTIVTLSENMNCLEQGGGSYWCSHNLQSDQQGSCQRICVLIMRITSKPPDSTVLRRNKFMAAQGRTVSHYFILLNRKFFGFGRFSDKACGFLFLLNNFPSPLQSLEYATHGCVKLIRTAEELSYRAVFCCKP